MLAQAWHYSSLLFPAVGVSGLDHGVARPKSPRRTRGEFCFRGNFRCVSVCVCFFVSLFRCVFVYGCSRVCLLDRLFVCVRVGVRVSQLISLFVCWLVGLFLCVLFCFVFARVFCVCVFVC